jgi:hypothetical protein
MLMCVTGLVDPIFCGRSVACIPRLHSGSFFSPEKNETGWRCAAALLGGEETQQHTTTQNLDVSYVVYSAFSSPFDDKGAVSLSSSRA